MRKSPRNRYYPLYFGLPLLIGFGALAFAATRNPASSLDLSVASFVQSFESPSLTKVMELFTVLGSAKVSALVALLSIVLLYVVLRHRLELVFLCCVVGGSAVMNQLMKMVFHRERPSVHRLIEETGFSFPSGHTMGAIALYGALAFLLWRHIPKRFGRVLLITASCAIIFMIGISRIYLGVHYPSDVLAGLLASGFWFSLVVYLYQLYMERRSGKRAIGRESMF